MSSEAPSVIEVCHMVRRHLAGTEAAPLNALAVALTASDTSVAFSYEVDTITAGSYIAIEDEILYVWEATGLSAQVARGMLGSTAVAHAVGTIVEAPTRFPIPRIKDTMVEEVRSWPDNVYQVLGVTASWPQDSSLIDPDLADTDFIHILDVLVGPTTWTTGDRWKHVRFDVHRQVDTVIEGIDGETVIQVLDNYPDCDRQARILYAAPFTPDDSADDTNVVNEWGVPTSAIDIISLGAAARLLLASESVRLETDAMQESRQAEQVPPQALTQAGLALWRIRERRLGEEAMRLRARHPVVTT